jgi:hypothetical protein
MNTEIWIEWLDILNNIHRRSYQVPTKPPSIQVIIWPNTGSLWGNMKSSSTDLSLYAWLIIYLQRNIWLGLYLYTCMVVPCYAIEVKRIFGHIIFHPTLFGSLCLGLLLFHILCCVIRLIFVNVIFRLCLRVWRWRKGRALEGEK